MLEFKEVFAEGAMIYAYECDSLLKCKNIDFSHCGWTYNVFIDHTILCHIVDNIIDINAVEHKQSAQYTLLMNLTRLTTSFRRTASIDYLLNNGYINVNTFDGIKDILNKYEYLVTYLTKVSLNKFTGFYNIEKYYDMITIMLLILKAHQTNLPTTVIKHLIIPFIYQ